MDDPAVRIEEAEDAWRVVRARKGKPRGRRNSQGNDAPPSCCAGHSPSPGNPASWDAEQEHKLRARIQQSMERVRSSEFFKTLVAQMQSLQIVELLLANANEAAIGDSIAAEAPTTVQFSDGGLVAEDNGICDGAAEMPQSETAAAAVAGTDTMSNVVEVVNTGDSKLATRLVNKVEVVVLGVGSILNSEVSRCQISLALLLRDHYRTCIETILVYDPVLSTMECGLLTTLGCTPVVHDEQGRRLAHSPTLFYMPHCGASLYNNLLQENLDPWRLAWVSVLGNSFQKYQERWAVFPQPKHRRPDCLLQVQKHVTEHPVDAASFPHLSAFNDMSWHLFPLHKVL